LCGRHDPSGSVALYPDPKLLAEPKQAGNRTNKRIEYYRLVDLEKKYEDMHG
jgi:hypothetical protein